MEKLILLPQSKYDRLTTSKPNPNTKPAENKTLLSPPPPGIPAHQFPAKSEPEVDEVGSDFSSDEEQEFDHAKTVTWKEAWEAI